MSQLLSTLKFSALILLSLILFSSTNNIAKADYLSLQDIGIGVAMEDSDDGSCGDSNNDGICDDTSQE